MSSSSENFSSVKRIIQRGTLDVVLGHFHQHNRIAVGEERLPLDEKIVSAKLQKLQLPEPLWQQSDEKNRNHNQQANRRG